MGNLNFSVCARELINNGCTFLKLPLALREHF